VSLLRFIPELPLLRRELIELSNRRRTYIIRFLGAIVILTFVVFTFLRQINAIAAGVPGITFAGGFPVISRTAWNPNKFLGTGGIVFSSIVPMLFHFIQVLMPALICGSITLEKERNTLGTLFVTRLSPMTIVIEKLGSRLVPMFTFLLLTFPLLAFVYSLGGVDTTLLLSTLWLLVCECLFYATIGLMCSSWFATTVTAFIWSYVLTGMFVLFSQILRIPVLTPFDVWQSAFTGYGGYEQGLLVRFFEYVGTPIKGRGAGSSRFVEVAFIVAASLPSLLMAAIFLILARVFLIRRAFVSSSSMLLRVFKQVDGFFTRLNDRTTGGVVLIRDHDSLPHFDPVAWRERAKKSLGKARYLFRILVALEGPTMFICLGAATVSQSTDFSALRGLLFLMWGIAAIILTVKASTMISSERTRETLDALLSTPLTAREILEQKIAGMRRLMIVLSIPILSIHLTLLLMHFELKSVFLSPTLFQTASFLLYCLMTAATTFTVMHLISWMSTLLGLRSSTQSRSVLAAVAVMAGWLVLSIGIASPGAPGYEALLMLSERAINTVLPGLDTRFERESIQLLASFGACLIRPDGSIQANEAIIIAATNARPSRGTAYYALSQSIDTAITAALVVFSMHFILTLLVRTLTLRLASRLLGRQDEKATMQPVSQTPAPVKFVPSESVA